MMGIFRRKQPRRPVEHEIVSVEEQAEIRLTYIVTGYAGVLAMCEKHEEILREIKVDQEMVIADVIRYTKKGLILPGTIPFVGLVLPSFFLKGLPFTISGKALEEKINPNRFDIKWNSHWLYGVRIEDIEGRNFEEIRTIGKKRGLLTTIEVVNLYILCPRLLKQYETHKVLCVSPRYPGRFRIITIQREEREEKQLVFECSVADYGDSKSNVPPGIKLASCYGRMPVAFLDS